MTNEILGKFTLGAEIERFHPGDLVSGRRSETLIKTGGLRVVLVTMLAGKGLHEHLAPGPITIHCLRGRFVVSMENQTHELAEGELISLAAGVRHGVNAVEDGAFLLTIGWGADSPTV